MKNSQALFVLVIFLASCTSQPIPPFMPTAEILPSPVLTQTITTTSFPTSTPTTLPLPTPSPTITSPIERHCPNFMGEVSMETVARGTIFPSNPKTKTVWMLDLQSGQKYSVPLDGQFHGFEGDISPNRKYRAYTEYNKERSRTIIRVINAKADVLVKKIVNNYLFNLRWLDNESLLFDTIDTEEKAKVVVLNLKTSEFSNVTNDLPGLFIPEGPGLIWTVSYSPDLQKVFYMGKSQTDAGPHPIYHNLVSQKTLWESPIAISGPGVLLWSPDGQRVALMINGDLYILQVDGHVTDVLEKSRFGYITEWSYEWSPNGQYIAFWASENFGVDNTAALMIYDVKSQITMNYCVDGYNNASSPEWSPDSIQVIVDSVDNGTILLDLPTNRSFKLVDIPNVSYPGGWMYSASGK